MLRKEQFKKAAEATGDLTGNKIAYKITSVSKTSSAELHSKNADANSEIELPKKRYTSPEERQQIIDELRLYNHGISKNSKYVKELIKSTI